MNSLVKIQKQKKIKRTKQIVAQQIIKCRNDILYFIKNYCYITKEDGSKIKFSLWQFQQAVLNQFVQNKLNIVLKSRQMGLSTVSSAFVLWDALFKQNRKTCIISNKQKSAINVLRKVSLAYNNLPEWFKKVCQIKKDNPMQMQFRNGSRIFAQAASADAGRSQSISILLLDQFAILSQRLANQIFLSAQPTIAAKGSKCIILSTPKGTTNQFARIYMDAVQNLNGFNPIQLQWYLRPDRDQQWFVRQRSKYSKKGFAQQYQCSLQASGDTVIQMQTIKYIQNQQNKQPLAKQKNNMLWIWKYPKEGHNYVLAADVARGDGGDYSAFHILDIDSLQQVVQFKGKVQTKQYANILYQYATMYFQCLLVVQNASIGWAVLQQLIDRHYKNLYYTQKDLQYVNAKTAKFLQNITDQKKGIPGFTTSSKTRPLIIQKMIQYIQQKATIINSKRLATQLISFIWTKSGKPQAMSGYNDDLVMSYAIALYVRDTAIKYRQKGRQRTKTMLSLTSKTTINPFQKSGYQTNNQQPWLVTLADGTIIDTRTM